MLPSMIDPAPVPIASEPNRDDSFYDTTVAIYTEGAAGFVPVDGLANLPGHHYPITDLRQFAGFQTARPYTDRVLLREPFPRINSSHFAEFVTPDGEAVFCTINDIDRAGDDGAATLLLHRRGVDEA